MAHRADKIVELRSALIHLYGVMSHDLPSYSKDRDIDVADDQLQASFERLAADLRDILGVDFSDLVVSDSYGEIEYLRWAVGGMQELLGYSSDEEMEEAINLAEDKAINLAEDAINNGSIGVDERSPVTATDVIESQNWDSHTLAVLFDEFIEDRDLSGEWLTFLKKSVADVLDTDEEDSELIHVGDCHMTLQEFINSCESGAFIDDDGFGCYATSTAVFQQKMVHPSDVPGNLDRSYTHVVWYNK